MFMPRPLRKFVAVFRGDVSPVLISLSVIIGLTFGLVPGWSGLHVALLLVALVVNTHIGIVGLAAATGRALCYAAAPLLYHAGVWVHGNLGGLLTSLASIPVVGLTDYDRYAIAGGIVLGPLLGVVLGLLLAAAVAQFRRSWLKLEDNSPRLREWQAKWWVRWLDWLLIGKRTKDVRKAISRRPRYIRMAGVAVAVVLLLLCGSAVFFIQGDRLRGFAEQQLTAANGAEVNLATLDLRPLSGRLELGGLAMTDPNAPQNDRIRVGTAAADIGIWSLLIGRVVVDELELSEVSFDQPRDTPGEVIVKPDAEEEESIFDPDRYKIDLDTHDIAKLEEYLNRTVDIAEKLEKWSKWVPAGKEKEPKPGPPTEYLAYLTARAPVQRAPRVVVSRVSLSDVDVPAEQFDRSTVVLENLSDAPRALGRAVRAHIKSNVKPAELTVLLRYDRPEGGADIEGRLADIQLAELQESLSEENPAQFRGGTATATLGGGMTRETVDLGIEVETQDMEIEPRGGGFFGLKPEVAEPALRALRHVKTRMQVVGPVGAPRLVLDTDALNEELQAALLEAGKSELANRLGEHLPEGTPPVDEVIEDPVGRGRDALDSFLGGGSDD